MMVSAYCFATAGGDYGRQIWPWSAQLAGTEKKMKSTVSFWVQVRVRKEIDVKKNSLLISNERE